MTNNELDAIRKRYEWPRSKDLHLDWAMIDVAKLLGEIDRLKSIMRKEIDSAWSRGYDAGKGR